MNIYKGNSLKKLLEVLDIFIIIFGQKEKINMKKVYK